MKTVSIDQATKTSGFSVYLDDKLTHYGILSSDQNEKNPITRMLQMREQIIGLLNEHKPDFVAIEGVQFQQNQATYSQLSQMQGVVFAIMFEYNTPFVIVEPSVWKSFCGVKGRKRQEQKECSKQLVKEAHNIEVSDDISDAILIGFWAANYIKERSKKK